MDCDCRMADFRAQFTSLLGRPLMVACGIQGNENDSGAYQMTRLFKDPDSYLLPTHTGLFDGVFQSPLHRSTTRTGVLPLEGGAKVRGRFLNS